MYSQPWSPTPSTTARRARVAHAEALAREAAEERLAGGGAVQRDVAADDVVLGHVGRVARRAPRSAGRPTGPCRSSRCTTPVSASVMPRTANAPKLWPPVPSRPHARSASSASVVPRPARRPASRPPSGRCCARRRRSRPPRRARRRRRRPASDGRRRRRGRGPGARCGCAGPGGAGAVQERLEIEVLQPRPAVGVGAAAAGRCGRRGRRTAARRGDAISSRTLLRHEQQVAHDVVGHAR